jgi:hypothetical protein
MYVLCSRKLRRLYVACDGKTAVHSPECPILRVQGERRKMMRNIRTAAPCVAAVVGALGLTGRLGAIPFPTIPELCAGYRIADR